MPIQIYARQFLYEKLYNVCPMLFVKYLDFGNLDAYFQFPLPPLHSVETYARTNI